MFDLSITKLLVLAVIALVIFGPDQLPKMAGQLGRTLRELRRMADTAKADLSAGLGPDFAEFDVADLNPRTFVRKHLLDDLDGHPRDTPARDNVHPHTPQPHPPAPGECPRPHFLPSGERPPFDTDAT